MRTWVKGDGYCLCRKLNVDLMQLRYNVIVNKIFAAKRSSSHLRFLEIWISPETSGDMDPSEWEWKEGGK